MNRNKNWNPGIKPIQKTNLLVKEHLDAPTNPAATNPTRDTPTNPATATHKQEWWPVDQEPSSGQEEQRAWNDGVLKRWKESRIDWRQRTQVEEFEMEECVQEVYLPQDGSFACSEKETRRKRIRRTRILEQSWALFKICRKFLQDNEVGWKTRSTEEM